MRRLGFFANLAWATGHLDVQGELRHAGYINSWIELLKENARAIFTAALKASTAADNSELLVKRLQKLHDNSGLPLRSNRTLWEVMRCS